MEEEEEEEEEDEEHDDLTSFITELTQRNSKWICVRTSNLQCFQTVSAVW